MSKLRLNTQINLTRINKVYTQIVPVKTETGMFSKNIITIGDHHQLKTQTVSSIYADGIKNQGITKNSLRLQTVQVMTKTQATR